jgi:hypothetical protein
MSGWGAVHIDDLEAVSLFHGLVWRPVRRELGIRAFGINAYGSEKRGQLIVEDHDELSGGAGGHEEVYVVLRGCARFTVDGQATDAPAGTLVYIREPRLRRSAISEEEGTLVLAIGGEPGRAFEVSAWESYFAALPDLKGERWEDAITKIETGLRDRPNHPSILYNLACAEALAGRKDDALMHLDAAITGDATYAETARTDPDLDSVRDSPGFPSRS